MTRVHNLTLLIPVN